jgi:uncharacterized membrane protein YvlD (DUF360 family)
MKLIIQMAAQRRGVAAGGVPLPGVQVNSFTAALVAAFVIGLFNSIVLRPSWWY